MKTTNTLAWTLNHELTEHIHRELTEGVNRLKYEVLLSEKIKSFLFNAQLVNLKRLESHETNSSVKWVGKLTDGTTSYRFSGATDSEGNYNFSIIKISVDFNSVIPPEYKEFKHIINLLTPFPFSSFLPEDIQE